MSNTGYFVLRDTTGAGIHFECAIPKCYLSEGTARAAARVLSEQGGQPIAVVTAQEWAKQSVRQYNRGVAARTAAARIARKETV